MAAMQDFNGAVCDALIDFMSDHGISQVQVAARLDRSQSYVSGRLNGKLDLSLDIIGAVAELARITPKALWIEVIERTGQASSER